MITELEKQIFDIVDKAMAKACLQYNESGSYEVPIGIDATEQIAELFRRQQTNDEMRKERLQSLAYLIKLHKALKGVVASKLVDPLSFGTLLSEVEEFIYKPAAPQPKGENS